MEDAKYWIELNIQVLDESWRVWKLNIIITSGLDIQIESVFTIEVWIEKKIAYTVILISSCFM